MIFFTKKKANRKNLGDSVTISILLTSPKTSDGQPMVQSRPGVGRGSPLLYFADVCAGPGGFSEYVLWKKKWKAKGFGFTLKGSHDFKMEDFFAGPPESFERHYGVDGKDGDGDVFKVSS